VVIHGDHKTTHTISIYAHECTLSREAWCGTHKIQCTI